MQSHWSVSRQSPNHAPMNIASLPLKQQERVGSSIRHVTRRECCFQIVNTREPQHGDVKKQKSSQKSKNSFTIGRGKIAQKNEKVGHFVLVSFNAVLFIEVQFMFFADVPSWAFSMVNFYNSSATWKMFGSKKVGVFSKSVPLRTFDFLLRIFGIW